MSGRSEPARHLGEIGRVGVTRFVFVWSAVDLPHPYSGIDWEDPDDPTVVAENELLGAAASIDAAAKKLANLRPRQSSTHVSSLSFGLPFWVSFFFRFSLTLNPFAVIVAPHRSKSLTGSKICLIFLVVSESVLNQISDILLQLEARSSVRPALSSCWRVPLRVCVSVCVCVCVYRCVRVCGLVQVSRSKQKSTEKRRGFRLKSTLCLKPGLENERFCCCFFLQKW